eukprot:2603917-Pleurochrysis_carterae.AAC.1
MIAANDDSGNTDAAQAESGVVGQEVSVEANASASQSRIANLRQERGNKRRRILQITDSSDDDLAQLSSV